MIAASFSSSEKSTIVNVSVLSPLILNLVSLLVICVCDPCSCVTKNQKMLLIFSTWHVILIWLCSERTIFVPDGGSVVITRAAEKATIKTVMALLLSTCIPG